tara:strand:- start:587 stop:862 length:276 start_codon:yes stop_codon:yes gene_type:complete
VATKEEVKEAIKSAINVELSAEQKDALYLQSKKKGVLDMVQEKVISRKLLVFTVATALMWYGLDSETWGMIAMTYIGGQTAIDFAKVWRGM